MHAILGASEKCIATHPSDMCVALAALDAVVCVEGQSGDRRIPFDQFHRLPADTPHLDTNLAHGEVIVAVEVPSNHFGINHTYIKIRDRSSYAFALVSVAAALELDGDVVKEARVALGGVAHKPWRDREAEASLNGKTAVNDAFEQFADLLLSGATPQSGNGFKIELARRAIVRALGQAAAGTPQVQSDKTFR